MYRFEFSKKELDEIAEKALLNDLQKEIVEYKIKNYSNVKIASLVQCSTATLSREIKRIIHKIANVI